ncbi:MAG: cyclic nucleotide-binding domain-containing protein [Solirubrobacterales bacterium]
MQTIDELIAEAPCFEGMAPAHLELIAGCARNQVFDQGAYLMREGDPAGDFYVIRRGRVALETFVPQRGGLILETIESGELLGWSWLVPPYRTHLDARALTQTHSIRFDGACLRGKCEQDPALGYELMQRFVPVIVDRLQATRFRLLDVYGRSDAG